MNRNAALKSAGILTTITMFFTSILLALLNFSGGLTFRIVEISIPFVFFGLNLLLSSLLAKMIRKNVLRLILICANLALTIVYAVLILQF